MKTQDILTSLKASQPKLFTKLNDTEAKQFASALFEEIGRMLDNTEEGPVTVAKFGRFKVKQAPSKTDPNIKVRRVIFMRVDAEKRVAKKKKPV